MDRDAPTRDELNQLAARVVALERFIAFHATEKCWELHADSGRRHDAHERDLKLIADKLVPRVAALEAKRGRSNGR